MDLEILENYIEKIYGYAIKHTYSRDEADDLAQEILSTIVAQFPKLKTPDSFEPWLWGIARNVTKSFRRRMGKRREIYSFDSLEDLCDLTYEDNYVFENEEIYNSLRYRIAMLSDIYRNIIILHYYDGLSVEQISQKLNIPRGTITWRLSEARKKIKKEYENMNATALKPVKLLIRITGEGQYDGIVSPFPHVYIDDALSQNILYYCYNKPKTTEELANLCGVPAYYIEDAIENLIKHEALSKLPKGKYRTEFIIHSNETKEYHKNHMFLLESVTCELIDAMPQLCESSENIGIYTAGKSKNERVYLYALLALEHLSKKYNPIHSIDYPVRYDGFHWSFVGHLITNNPINVPNNLGREESSNLGSRGSYKHISYHFAGFSYRAMMLSDEINVCEDILVGREITDKDAAASAIAKGFINRSNNGELSVTTPAFTKEQKKQFDTLAEQAFHSSMPAYSNAVGQYVDGYRKLFPEHLHDDVTRACHYLFLGLFPTIVQIGKEKNLLPPVAENSICDVLIQHK